MRLVRVIKKHTSEFSVPLVMAKDDIIDGEKRKTEWDGWIWCKNIAGVFGWVPEPFLEKLPEERKYGALRDYNAFEVSVDIGQELMILEEASSWAWVRTPEGEEGWVPLENLENVSKSATIPDFE
ncbi:MAG: hypothetical protein ACW98Y_12150 [Candidatus Thorarchaeota archaeon]